MNFVDFIYSLIFEEKSYVLDDTKDIVDEINEFESSKKRQDMILGHSYFLGVQDIENKQRMAIVEQGKLEPVENVPNNKIVNNLYHKVVVQKANYMVGKPFIVDTDNRDYQNKIKKVLDKNFQKQMYYLTEDCINQGISWLYPYINLNGKLCFQEFRGYEIIPIWENEFKTDLLGAITWRDIEFKGEIKRKVQVFTKDGIHTFWIDNNRLVEDSDKPFQPYITKGTQGYGWGKVPLIPFRFNRYEQPLIARVKSLQDAINTITSTFEDRIEEDPRQTIMVVVNYDGEDLGEFRRNLAELGAVKVSDTDGGKGDLKTLDIKVDSSNYQVILKELKKALIENAMGYDAKDDKVGQNANELNLKSMYNDIDLETNSVELEFKSSLDELMYFVNMYLNHKGDDIVEFIFNRDMIMNEMEKINEFVISNELSMETRLANHPWIRDVNAEMKRIKKQEKDLTYGYDTIGEEDLQENDKNTKNTRNQD